MAWKCPVEGCVQTNERSVDLTKHVLLKLDKMHEEWKKKNVSLKGKKGFKEVAEELEEKFEMV